MSVDSSVRPRRRKKASPADVPATPYSTSEPGFAATRRSDNFDLPHSEIARGTPAPNNRLAETEAFRRRFLQNAPLTLSPTSAPESSSLAALIQPEAAADAARRVQIFHEHGNFTMAYATLQPGMKYFESHGGYLAYDKCWGIPFVLGDPVAPVEHHAAILEAFVRRNPRACFCQISKPAGAVLDRLGWFVNEFGADMELDLPNYDFSGPKKAKLRQAANKIEREGYAIEERTGADEHRAELDALCASWLAKKTVKREARFLVRPVAFGDEPGVRKFYLRDSAGFIVSFVAFDPICEGGEVIGYSPAIKRHSGDAPTGAEEAMTKFAIEQFRAEGLKTFRLGLFPLYRVENSALHDEWMLRLLFQMVYRYGDRWLYSFRGLADFKHRYRGTMTKVYFATPLKWNMWSLSGLLRVCGLF